MELWFIIYIMPPIIGIVYDISILIVYDISIIFCLWRINFKAVREKNWLHRNMGNKTDKPIIAIKWIQGSLLTV